MNIYLQRLAKSIKNKQSLLIMDGASWHKSIELKIPKNIEIIRLPPYCIINVNMTNYVVKSYCKKVSFFIFSLPPSGWLD
jgi:transposase